MDRTKRGEKGHRDEDGDLLLDIVGTHLNHRSLVSVSIVDPL